MHAIFDNEQAAIQAEAEIHQWLTVNRPGYNAERWANVAKHPTENLWSFPLPPEPVEIAGAEIVENLTPDWFPAQEEI
jgi:hypothetical protein